MGVIKPVIPGTTPDVSVKLHDTDLTGLLVYLTFEHRRGEMTKHGSDVSVVVDTDAGTGETYSIVSTSLTQAETLGFPEDSTVKIQVRACNADGSVAVATYAGEFPTDEVLLAREIPGEV